MRDRGEKLKEFRSLPSLEEYVLIRSTEVGCAIDRWGEEHIWLASQRDELIWPESVDFECAIALRYEGVRLS